MVEGETNVYNSIKVATIWSGGQHHTLYNGPAWTFFGPLRDGSVYFTADKEFESERMDDREENVDWYRHWGSERLKKVQAGEAVSESGLASSYAGSGGFGVHIPSPPVTGSRNPPLSSAAKAALDSQYAHARQVYDSYAQGAANEQWLNEFREGSTATVIGFNDLHTQVFEGRSTLWVWADSAHQPHGTFSAWVEAQVVGWGENIFPTFRKTMYSVVDGSSGGMFPEIHPWETFHSSGSQAHGEPLADIKVNNEGTAIYHKLFYEYTQWGTQVTRREGMIKIGAAPEAIPGAKSVADLNEKLASPEGPYMVGTKGENQPTMWCYNNGAFASIDLRGAGYSAGAGQGGVGYPVRNSVAGRGISNRLEIPLGEHLWRNSRLRKFEDLCGNTAAWSKFRIFTISPNTGILTGSALKDTNGDGQLQASPYGNDGPDKFHSVLLLPVELVDTKDGILDDLAPQGTTITAAMRDVNIEPKATVEEQKERSIAWIEPHGEDNGNNGPDMPQLALRFRGTEQMGLKIKWKLEVIYDRPRGTNPNEAQITAQDEVFIPKTANGTQPWKEEVLDGAVEFFNHADWIAALQEKGFFGGEAKLTYQLLKADGSALGTESTMLFSIGGKNPEDGLAKDYIDAKATAADARLTRLSYAVARHESKDYNGAGSRYNQFWEGYARRFRHDHKRGHPLWCLSTGESSAGGFGIFQITGNLSSKYAIIPREQMWNWQKNTDAYITIIKTGGTAAKGSVMDRFIAAVARTYPSDNEAQNPPTNYPYDGGNYDAWEMGTITLYNGAGGCPKSLLKSASGKVFEPINPWKYFPSGTAGSRWRYHKNSNNYLHEVIEQR